MHSEWRSSGTYWVPQETARRTPAIPRIAKRTVDALVPHERERVVWDDEIKGFGVRVHPTGRRVYIVKYRHKGRVVKTTIGPHGPIAPAEARGLASPPAVAAIRLPMLTGCRRSEILTLHRNHVDLEAGELRLPDSKTGAKAAHLGDPAIDVLRAIPEREGDPFVIAGSKPGRPMKDLQHYWERIRKRAGLDDVRIHDLRHSFASGGLRVGEGLPMIGKLLGHSNVHMTARYAHLANDPVKSAANRIASRIAGIAG